MSGQEQPEGARLPAREELESGLTVFEGSSPQDVSHARQLWRSATLPPPREPRLVKADVGQRLPVASGTRRLRHNNNNGAPASATAAGPPGPSADQLRSYRAMARQREESMARLRSQRELRIQKEQVSRENRPNKVAGERRPDLREDRESVKQLK